MSLSSHQRPVRGASDVWLTPPQIIAAVGPFDLDPCAAPIPRPWDTAASHITLPADGLAAEWPSGSFVWCNPPFGPEAGSWLDRMADHGHGIALVPARTETRWFVRSVWQRAYGVLFLHGRPRFHRPDGTQGSSNSGAPICLVAYGAIAHDRLYSSGLAGSLVSMWKATA